MGKISKLGAPYVNPDMPPEVARLLAAKGFNPDGTRNAETRQKIDRTNQQITDDWREMGFMPFQTVADPRAQYVGNNRDLASGGNSPLAYTGEPAFGVETRAKVNQSNRQLDTDMRRSEALVEAILGGAPETARQRPAPQGATTIAGRPDIPASAPRREAVGPSGPTPVARPMIPGNIDLTRRPKVKNPDGSISTVRSMSYGLDDGREVLIPTVSDDGRVMSDDEAIRYWGERGQHLGIFGSPAAADEYAQRLHTSQARMLDEPGLGGVPPVPKARPRPDSYTVKAGDNPTTIARAMGLTLKELEAKNPGIINRAKRLKVGSKVRL